MGQEELAVSSGQGEHRHSAALIVTRGLTLNLLICDLTKGARGLLLQDFS